MKNNYNNPTFFNAYKSMTRSKEGLSGAGEWVQFKEMFPDVKDMCILDLGCGYGWHAKYMVEQGAKTVVAIDHSEKMIQEALTRNADEKIAYKVIGIMDYAYPFETYDLVLSNLALHYIDDLDEVYRNIAKTLKPNGIFLLNIEHPTYTSGVNQEWIYKEDGTPDVWPVDRYYEPGLRSTQFLGHTIEKYHHTLTQIVNGLINTGMTIDALVEAEPSKDALDIDGMMYELKRPMMLLIKATKNKKEHGD
ncbi:hypothetical protein AOC36_11505 [Erysipelothrix larvae]|uniref:Methyltransferase type 11 domain-containing protein n=1 Tax=Erysipelothrix larvae TaxID=1514105 RepID=A0A109UHP9_9FIRM|nr:class I SAM-dependent methyltransferase [Erysipelothrix larvae]AMC94575.1 hypothetical protein AOC36_11505 [Erysipelothrix larvae]